MEKGNFVVQPQAHVAATRDGGEGSVVGIRVISHVEASYSKVEKRAYALFWHVGSSLILFGKEICGDYLF